MHVNADKYSTEQETPAWKIFNTYIEVSIANMFLYPETYLENHGIISHNLEEARSEMKSMRRVRIKISEVISYRADGADIIIHKPEDTVKAYTYITNHLKDWYEIILSGRYMKHPPLDDLVDMDNFARELHHYYALQEVKKLNSNTQSNGLKGKTFFELSKPKVYKLEDIPKYISYIPAIINKLGDSDGDFQFGTEI